MELSTRTTKALAAANITDPAGMTDEQLLAISGIGPSGVREIRAASPDTPTAGGAADGPEGGDPQDSADTAPDAVNGDVVLDAQQSDDEDTASEDDDGQAEENEPDGDGQPSCVSPTPSGSRCWQVTRCRYVGGKRERFCETCGAVESAVTLTDRGIRGR